MLKKYKTFIFSVEDLLGSGPTTNSTNFGNDPWAPAPPAYTPTNNVNLANDPWAAFEASPGTPNSGLNGNGITSNGSNGVPMQRTSVKTPESFLGENSSLVNLDNLMGPPSAQAKTGNFNNCLFYSFFSASNPFIIGTTSMNNGNSVSSSTNPFNAQQRPAPSINELMQAQKTGSSIGGNSTTPNASTNPFAL